jgi:hypothetical protein
MKLALVIFLVVGVEGEKVVAEEGAGQEIMGDLRGGCR